MVRFMNASNIGTVNAVSPWLGLQIMPLAMSWLRVGPRDVTFFCSTLAMSPDRRGPLTCLAIFGPVDS